MKSIISDLLGDSPQLDRSFGISPPPAYVGPMPASRTSSFTTATGSTAVKGNQGGGGFVIPAGMTRPNRSVPVVHPGKAGVKRSAEEAFASGKAAITGVPGVGGKAKATADRTVLTRSWLRRRGFEKGTAVIVYWKLTGLYSIGE